MSSHFMLAPLSLKSSSLSTSLHWRVGFLFAWRDSKGLVDAIRFPLAVVAGTEAWLPVLPCPVELKEPLGSTRPDCGGATEPVGDVQPWGPGSLEAAGNAREMGGSEVVDGEGGEGEGLDRTILEMSSLAVGLTRTA